MGTRTSRRPGLARAAASAAAWSVALAGLLLPLAAAAGTPGEGPYGDYHHGMWGGGWIGMGFGFIMMIAVIAGIVAVIVLLFRALGGGGRAAPRRDGKSALDILEERFARGEIDAQEFEERRRLLSD